VQYSAPRASKFNSDAPRISRRRVTAPRFTSDETLNAPDGIALRLLRHLRNGALHTLHTCRESSSASPAADADNRTSS